ncbi:MAG: Trk system potassium transporter TrkA [Thermoleophilia bacterium]|nr:Trk system potassium transporter TrkA [Thermoleophilia bacterium]
MRIFLIGAGQVGTTIAEALYDEHQLTVVDLDASRLGGIAHRFDVATVQGNGASRRALQEGGIRDAELVIACTSRDEANIIAAMLAKKLAPAARTIVRTANPEYLEVWRERQLEVDFMVSSEEETAHAVSRTVGVPAARQTDVFADGQVQVVEFDVEPGVRADGVVGLPLREAAIPPDSKVASIIRGDQAVVPRGDQSIQVGDRVVIIGSPEAARAWSALMARGKRRVDDVVVWGAGRAGTAIARQLLERNIAVRLIEADRERAREVADQLQSVRVFHATGFDPDFLERERVGHATAAVFAMRDDAKNLYGATLARLHGVQLTIALAHEKVSVEVFERAGIDVAINPRQLTAEEIVRFAHDPRTQQVAMLEGDRYEVLDVTVRPESALLNRPFRQLPMTGSLIGAIVRDGRAIFPHGDDVLLPGDRAIIFTDARRATEVERTL